MLKYSKIIILALSLGLTFFSYAQNTESTDVTKPKEFSIPASPVFDLMGVVPAQVNQTNNIKYFKVDWSFKSWRVSPNLAIQSQPIWEIFYNRKEITKYQKASPLMRKLSSFDLSLGTVQSENNDRRIGFAGKINLYKKQDPLLVEDLYKKSTEQYQKEKNDLKNQINIKYAKLGKADNLLQADTIKNELASLQSNLASLETRQQTEISNIAKSYVEKNWNNSFIDLAYGRIYTYFTDSAGSLKSLRLNRNTAAGLWLNFGFGIGKKILISGLVRENHYRELVSFEVPDSISTHTDSLVIPNYLFNYGFNIRYGTPKFTYFMEAIIEKKYHNTVKDAFDAGKGELTPQQQNVDFSKLKWEAVFPYTLALGGDWRVSRNLLISFGMRCTFTQSFKLQTFTPVANIACMMR